MRGIWQEWKFHPRGLGVAMTDADRDKLSELNDMRKTIVADIYGFRDRIAECSGAQITKEIWSANLYLSMAFYFDKEGFNGFANWMKKQSQEEMDHAYTMANYIIKRGGTARVGQIDAVPESWNSPLEVFEKVYEHECTVSKSIDDLVDIASAERDKATQDFLWSFVREQVEEEATASGIVDRIRKMGDSAIFNLDQQYGSRQ